MEGPLPIVAVLSASIALADWLARHTVARHLGTTLVVILLAALWVNVGVLVPNDGGEPTYGVLLGTVGPMAIFWLLLGVRLKEVLRAGMPMLVAFGLGAVGTMLGVFAGMKLAGGEEVFGELHHALGGMFVATYTGGSANFNLVAQQYGVDGSAALYLGAVTVDNAWTTIWMALSVGLPGWLSRFWPRVRMGAPGGEVGTADEGVPEVGLDREGVESRSTSGQSVDSAEGSGVSGAAGAVGLGSADDGGDPDAERVGPVDLAIVGVMGITGLQLARWIEATTGFPWSVALSLIALAAAQWEPVARLRGARVLGVFSAYLFLAAIGALCDLQAVREIGSMAGSLVTLVGVTGVVHGIVVFGGAALVGIDPRVAAVASQANIGGGTTAMVLARSLGRPDLVAPSILVGSLGTAFGTALGVQVAGVLG